MTTNMFTKLMISVDKKRAKTLLKKDKLKKKNKKTK